jgi:predicted DNA-binding transcriptional regulator AlpA
MVTNDQIENLRAFKEHRRQQALALLLEPLLTTRDLQRLLQVDRRTVTRLVKRGELPPPLKLGGCNRWRPEVINDAIDRLGHRVGRKITPREAPNEADEFGLGQDAEQDFGSREPNSATDEDT